jgi:pimeloyl-ACP methyl ester carboxylesterase
MPTLSIHGSALSYVERGTGFPVVFGTSYLWDAGMWAPQVEVLSRRYRCLVPELWGHGQSQAIPEVPYSMGRLATDMRAFVDALGIEQFALVGLSVGGMWGTELALDCAGRVRALALMDTFVGPEPPATQARYFAMLDMLKRVGRMPPALVDQVVPLFFAPETLAGNPALVDRFRHALLGIPSEHMPSIVALGYAIFSRPSLLERLPTLACPTLVVVGRGDRSRPVHEAEMMAKVIPGARLEIIEAAGHISSLEQPDQVNALLDGFLREALRA